MQMSSQHHCSRTNLNGHQHSTCGQCSITGRKLVWCASGIADNGASLGESHHCSRDSSTTCTSDVGFGKIEKNTPEKAISLTSDHQQLTNLLDVGNQANSREISTRILHLTQEGVDDNATVRVITVFTLIYLPASFMAVSLQYVHKYAWYSLIRDSSPSSA
jgi:hypothetical protein